MSRDTKVTVHYRDPLEHSPDQFNYVRVDDTNAACLVIRERLTLYGPEERTYRIPWDRIARVVTEPQ